MTATASRRRDAANPFEQGWRWLKARPALSRLVVQEAYRERAGGHPVDDAHRPHLESAVEWLVAAQDATPDDGVSRGYSLVRHPVFRTRGWQPSYPETTGYIIPTLYAAARALGRTDLAHRATRAARWEIDVQLAGGAVQGGVIGDRPGPAVFNTGQVMLGWLAAARETGEDGFQAALARAGRFLVRMMGPHGHWHRGNSRFARSDTTLYNTRTAWALAEAGQTLDEPAFVEAAACNLWTVVGVQGMDGWIPDCCLTDGDKPLLYTVAYAIRGLLEGGRALGDDGLIRHAALAAHPLAEFVRDDGWMPGRVAPGWRPAATWACLTGQAQMANVWLRLHNITGEQHWLEPVPRVLRYLKSTQNRTTSANGLRGGIRGAVPVGAPYGPYEVLNWATKFFIDGLLRHEQVLNHVTPPEGEHLA